MIEPGALSVEPWAVAEPSLRLDLLAQTETIFALSNGHIGLRGNLDEGEPHATPGTYLNSFYERRPLPYAEGGYGYPESGHAGGFGFVVGVDRLGHADKLREAGADVVVSDLAELLGGSDES